MLLAHAVILAKARSHIAALADAARTFDASVEYEHVLLELDRIHGDEAPALDSAGVTDDHGVDRLQIELVLDMLETARDKDEP